MTVGPGPYCWKCCKFKFPKSSTCKSNICSQNPSIFCEIFVYFQKCQRFVNSFLAKNRRFPKIGDIFNEISPPYALARQNPVTLTTKLKVPNSNQIRKFPWLLSRSKSPVWLYWKDSRSIARPLSSVLFETSTEKKQRKRTKPYRHAMR